MNTRSGSIMLSAMLAVFAPAQNVSYPKAKVSFEDFKGLVAEVETHRASRLIDLNAFLRMSKEPGVIILDTRSTFRFDRIHVQGAKHLSFTDFTQENLSQIIPSFDTKVLIYCNNNFDGNPKDFATKVAAPRTRPNDLVKNQLASQAKPIMLALNIPTYINLFGYGYRNVYELNEWVNVNDPRISFEGSACAKNPVMVRVTGIGGVFFKAKNPDILRAWYQRHLGFDIKKWGGVSFPGNRPGGAIAWSLFPESSKYFAPSQAAFMVDYVVEDLHAVLDALRAEGCDVDAKVDESGFGKFGWVMDPEGNRVELWQPPEPAGM